MFKLRGSLISLVAATALVFPAPAIATSTTCQTAFSSAQISPSVAPTNLTPLSGTKIPSEGVWKSTKIKVNGHVALKTTRVRFDKIHGSSYATLIWIDSKLLAFKQIPGLTVPKKGLGTGKVSKSMRACYMAAFTGGYLMTDSGGGAKYGSTTVAPMKKKMGTLVTYTDGSMDVVKWPNIDATKRVAELRQNLKLIVENGISKVPAGEPHNSWGWVWHGTGINNNDVRRTGVGIRSDGTIVWVMGAELNATNLAKVLIRGGAIRAMALDMNKGFANGYLYGPYHTKKTVGGIIDPNMTIWPSRFWNAAQRDFIAVFSRS